PSTGARTAGTVTPSSRASPPRTPRRKAPTATPRKTSPPAPPARACKWRPSTSTTTATSTSSARERAASTGSRTSGVEAERRDETGGAAMTPPRVRFTVRRMMAAMVVVAVGLCVPSWARTAYRNYLISQQLRHYPPVALDLWHGRLVAEDRIERVIER